MSQFLTTLKLILSIVPAILDLITNIEKLFPEAGQGVAKLEMIKSTLSAIWQGATDAVPAFESVWPKIQAVISALVSIFNQSGIFKK